MEDRRISDLQKAIGELAQKAQQEQLKKAQEERIRVLTEIYTVLFEKSTAYANVIIIAGYAGMFTTWSLSKEHLSNTGNATVALLLSASLIVFCAWEVFKMIFTGVKQKEFALLVQRQLPPETFFSEIAKIEENEKRRATRLMYPWYVVLLIAIPTGFGAGGILMWNFLASVVGWPTWP